MDVDIKKIVDTGTHDTAMDMVLRCRYCMPLSRFFEVYMRAVQVYGSKNVSGSRKCEWGFHYNPLWFRVPV